MSTSNVGNDSVTEEVRRLRGALRKTHHLEEQVSEPLLLGREARVALDADQEPALEVGELVQVDEEAVDLILRQDVARLQLALVVLCDERRQATASSARMRFKGEGERYARETLNAFGGQDAPAALQGLACTFVPSRGSRARRATARLTVPGAARPCENLLMEGGGRLEIRARRATL